MTAPSSALIHCNPGSREPQSSNRYTRAKGGKRLSTQQHALLLSAFVGLQHDIQNTRPMTWRSGRHPSLTLFSLAGP